MTPEKERFDRFVDKSGECWTWTGSQRGTTSVKYGAFRLDGRQINAHRAAWIMERGDPGALCVLHRCDNGLCVRMDHLFLGTLRDNAADRERKGRGNLALARASRARSQRAKSHCKRGHELSGDNLRIYYGRRHCLACRALHHRGVAHVS